MRRRNRPRRLAPMSTPLELRKCLYCGADFTPNRSWQKYCCQEHSMTAYYHRKYGDPTQVAPADAKPHVVAKLDDMPNLQFQDEQTEEASRTAELLKNIPTGKETPAAQALSNLGYGIPELDEEDKDAQSMEPNKQEDRNESKS